MTYLKTVPLLLLLVACASKIPSSYVLDEKDLVPEGIAYSKKNNAFYLTSVAKSKIIAVDKNSGKQTDFISANEFGYQPGVGILVDDQRNLVHAIGGYARMPDSLSALYTFDSSTQKLLKRYNAAPGDFLNDLIQDSDGNLYVTNSEGASVFILKPGTDSLELFYESPEIQFPNGIAISDDQTKLYIASFEKGVRILDISTRRLVNEADSLGISQGIDGLEFYKGHLYAIQNGSRANGFNFRKLVLNSTQDGIIDMEIIDSGNPDLYVPLTFAVAGNEAIVIGNSNLGHLNQETMQFEISDTIPKTKLLTYTID
ncbi:SMP-30/gluconolactonase/LRE family protein [Maribacter sp. 2307UL18-2]|uniref:SMP-30/gluconolactonase/LRE family protein n=1 Tax=Maribacter sp. 2307UL18-2 TaxID=3386274 RepID=UPI0039BD3B6B